MVVTRIFIVTITILIIIIFNNIVIFSWAGLSFGCGLIYKSAANYPKPAPVQFNGLSISVPLQFNALLIGVDLQAACASPYFPSKWNIQTELTSHHNL